jgi:hypothetical protein
VPGGASRFARLVQERMRKALAIPLCLSFLFFASSVLLFYSRYLLPTKNAKPDFGTATPMNDGIMEGVAVVFETRIVERLVKVMQNFAEVAFAPVHNPRNSLRLGEFNFFMELIMKSGYWKIFTI